ncbi:hypothetical protein [Hymenobacter edaphi]|uniref:Uncharacterized protein n=1 Tax=Hymenobacter edaphi TaxID=2211146 RepID=A0A328BF04_9BACT|nr:hypothetical protein [Hymenobacter edaphi]RAK66010.1 hypothetical protein DLM85_15000 [Hymenobacter edaphi]
MELQAAIDNLYKVFARYPLNPNMDGSPMYAELPEWNQQLASKPLRALTAEDLSIFTYKSLTTWGEETDFKHFLPRIFELLPQFPSEFAEEWIVIDKLNYGRWRTWPETEQQAILDYLWALWEYMLTTPNTGNDFRCGDCLAAIASVYPDFEQLLLRWEQADARKQVALGTWVYWSAEVMLAKRMLPGFYNSAERGPAFYAWLTTEATVARLEAAFFSVTDEEQAEQLSAAIQLLEAERHRAKS